MFSTYCRITILYLLCIYIYIYIYILKSIDKTCQLGKMKTWYYQHNLLLRLLWPLQMYERIQQYNIEYLRKWLRVRPCFSKIGLYTNFGNLLLPVSSLVEEFKIRKVRLHMMMKESAEEVIQKAYQI